MVDELAMVRSQIAQRLSEGNPDDACDRYIVMVDRFHEDTYNTTLHRDAQYQIANHLFSRGDHDRALDAYDAFLAEYPDDPEKDVIKIMTARIRAPHDPDRAIETLKALVEQSDDTEIVALAQRELGSIRTKEG